MHPSNKNHYPPPADTLAIPEVLLRSFVATIDSFNAGIYGAAAVSGRRTLEGILKFRLPEDKRKLPLMQLIEAVRDDVDLAAPLAALSHAIRAGGNLGAHFDMEREPNEAVARQIVELVDYLISYLYVLPQKIKQLEDELSKVEYP